MSNDAIRAAIENAQTCLGIEFGSTRIKAVLTDSACAPVASGSHSWENKLENGIWTYSLEDIWDGLRDCYASLAADVAVKYGVPLAGVGAMGVSGMMHGYLPFDAEGELLTPFRTWRNTITGEAAERLTEAFSFNIPQRWSIAHLYQAILNGEEHVGRISHLTTLAGYIHWRLTGQKVMGVGEASGMFPIDANGCFDADKLAVFDKRIADRGFAWKLADILPEVRSAGQAAGELTAEGVRLLDPTGTLKPGIPMCPPEGDAGTGMVATASVAPRTGNVSAGTSVFAMAVLERPLSRVYPEIDIVTTPSGDPVAMVHCNNCTGDLDAWVGLFREFLTAYGAEADTDKLYATLYNAALTGDADCGGLLAYNYCSGEHITGFTEGRPMFVRRPDSALSLSNFMRAHLYTAMGALKTGMDILFCGEGVGLDGLTGHGGLFKVPGAGQRIVAAALNTPVTVMSTAGEGGPWGMAILASYMISGGGKSLFEYLTDDVFKNAQGATVEPCAADVAGFESFMGRYTAGLCIERAAVETL